MKRKEIILSLLFFILVGGFFFYKVFFLGYIPFPGDLLISEYNPWKTYSYLGYTPGSYPEKAQYFDTIRQIYPWKTFIISLLKNGQLPLWNPYNFSGSPLFANVQSAVLYPFNIIYFLFSQTTGWTILIVLQPLLCGFFTYLFAREIKISPKGSLISSIAFSYSLFMIVFLEYNTIGHVILWLSLMLYASEKMLKRNSFWNFALFVLGFVFSILAGHLQIFAFVIAFVFAYVVFRISVQSWNIRRKILYGALFFFLYSFAFGISGILLFPTLELINLSARSAQSYQFLVEKLLIQPSQLILFLSPDFFGNPVTRNYLISDTYPTNSVYIGLIPFIFSLFALLVFKKNYYVKYFSLSSLLLLILLVRSPLTELLYKLQIPLFSTGSPSNAIFLLSFSLSILAGFGTDLLLNKFRGFFWKITFSVLLLFLFYWMSILIGHSTIISSKNLLYSTGVLFIFIILFILLTLKNKYKNIISILFLFITILDFFYFFHKFNPFVAKELIFPPVEVFSYLQKNAGVNRFWGYGSASVEANFAAQYNLFSPDGYDPLYPKWYGEFIQSSADGKIKTDFTNKTRSDAIIVSGFGETDLSSNLYRLRVLDALGVKYVLDRIENASTEKTFPGERFKVVYEKDGWRIFENLKAAPRAFLTSNFKIFNNREQFENTFFGKDFDVSRAILLEKKPNENIDTKFVNDGVRTSTLQMLSYQPNKILFSTTTKSPTFLFLSDSYYPGWRAYVDDRETNIYRADYAFRAIVVPEGEHTITFEYKPESFSFGVKTSIMSILFFFVFVFWVTRWRLIHEK